MQQIFDALNEEYFAGALQLSIRWSRSSVRKALWQRRLGSYSPSEKLIRIHPLLAREEVPSYFIRYIVYHEMLHHVCPPRCGKRRRAVHHKEYREQEKLFKEYALAQQWKQKNLEKVMHGWS